MKLDGTPREVEAEIMRVSAAAGTPFTRSKANRIMRRFMRGDWDSELLRVLHYADPTGDKAVALPEGRAPHETARSFVRPAGDK